MSSFFILLSLSAKIEPDFLLLPLSLCPKVETEASSETMVLSLSSLSMKPESELFTSSSCWFFWSSWTWIFDFCGPMASAFEKVREWLKTTTERWWFGLKSLLESRMPFGSITIDFMWRCSELSREMLGIYCLFVLKVLGKLLVLTTQL